MEGRGLGAEGPRSSRLRMAREAELVDAGPEELVRVVRAVRLMAGEAVAARAGDVVEHERSAHLGVAIEAGELSLRGHLDRRVLPGVRRMAVEAGHPAAIDAMGVGLVLERLGLRRVACGAELARRLRDQARALGRGVVDRVAGEAVHSRGVRVDAVAERVLHSPREGIRAALRERLHRLVAGQTVL